MDIKFFSLANLTKFSLIDKLDATPPAMTKVFVLFSLFIRNSFMATLVFSYKISLIVFWKDAAKWYFSFSFFNSLEVLSTAVLRPAKDKLQPPFLRIGLVV